MVVGEGSLGDAEEAVDTRTRDGFIRRGAGLLDEVVGLLECVEEDEDDEVEEEELGVEDEERDPVDEFPGKAEEDEEDVEEEELCLMMEELEETREAFVFGRTDEPDE